MAAPKSKVIKTTLEETPQSEENAVVESTEETVTLTETFARHGSIVTRFGIIEFTNGQATVSTALADELRQQGMIL